MMTIKKATPNANVGGRVALLLGVLVAACNGNHVLGVVNGPDATGAAGTTDQMGGGGASGSPLSGRLTPGVGGATDCTMGAGGYVGSDVNTRPVVTPGSLGPTQTWTGYSEGLTFPSGSESIKLSFASDAAGNLVGTAVFGAGTPPPPGADPILLYPPSGSPWHDILEGYAYQLQGGKLLNQHLTFSVAFAEVWSQWCAMQTPRPCVTSCIPPGNAQTSASGACVYRASNTNESFDCRVAIACENYCNCESGTCRAVLDIGGRVFFHGMVFDLFVAGDTASGSAPPYGSGAAHFTKNAAPGADGGT